MGIRRLNDLATTKAYLQVDDVDLIRANTDNTWPITARYVSNVTLIPDSNITITAPGSYQISFSGFATANANLIVDGFDIGVNNVTWIAANTIGVINGDDFILGSNVGNISVSALYGVGQALGNIGFKDDGANVDDVSVIGIYIGDQFVQNIANVALYNP